MIKKIFSIFIYILLTGCDTLTGPEESNYLELSAPSLSRNSDGYYMMTANTNLQQTFTTLKASTGSIEIPQLLTWESNKEFSIEWQGQTIWENVVNGSSYTDDEGYGYTVLGIYDIFIGDTIKVYCGFVDDYDNYYEDYLEVIVE